MDTDPMLREARRWPVQCIIASVVVICVVGSAGAASVMVLKDHGNSSALFPTTILILLCSFIACGAALSHRVNGAALGLVLTCAGLGWLLRALLLIPHPVARAIGILAYAMPIVLVVQALAMFPDDRRRGAVDRWLMRVTWALPLVLIPNQFLHHPNSSEPSWTGLSPADPVWVSPGRLVAYLYLIVLGSLLLASLVRRRHRLTPAFWPAFGLGLAVGGQILLVAGLGLAGGAGHSTRVVLNAVGVAVLVLVPPALLAGSFNLWFDRDLAEARRSARHSAAAARRSVQRDLHDGAQLRLLNAAMVLKLALARAARDGDETMERLLIEASDELGRALDGLRTTAGSGGPEMVRTHGLAGALRELTVAAPQPVTLLCPPELDLPADVSEAVYYTVSEALANVARHAHARSVSVSLRAEPVGQTIRLQVRDDGIGGAHAGSGRGLSGLADRITGIGGTFEVDSPPGHGTILEAVIPCESSLLMTQP
ncbi:MAG TPA: ATP-binding protein [Mycobacteriales bacterium]|nr:ATP-binding protein [Mycobacteriales bacterium]